MNVTDNAGRGSSCRSQRAEKFAHAIVEGKCQAGTYRLERNLARNVRAAPAPRRQMDLVKTLFRGALASVYETNGRTEALERLTLVRLFAMRATLSLYKSWGGQRPLPDGMTAGQLIDLVRSPWNEAQKIAAVILLDFYCDGWRSEPPALAALGYLPGRDSAEARQWRKAVVARDVVCVNCGGADNLHAHHIIAWSEAPELSLMLGNGTTLCGACHRDLDFRANHGITKEARP